MFDLYDKRTGKKELVYAVLDDSHGYPKFLIRDKNKWIYKSAKHFITKEEVNANNKQPLPLPPEPEIVEEVFTSLFRKKTKHWFGGDFTEGLKILSKSQIFEQDSASNILLVFVFGFILFLGIQLSVRGKKAWMFCLGILFTISSIISMMILMDNPIQLNTGKYEYKATISNEVRLLEFNDKYEIIRKEGELYIIRDK